MNNRRLFIKKLGLSALSLALTPKIVLAENNVKKITILHTNDMHSRILPFSKGKYKGLGGMAQRSYIIKKIRTQEKNVLLFDAGDIFQGTPYFNFYNGELELKLMSEIGYDASTMGNHDFDNGILGFHKQLTNVNFPFIVSNYDFSNTILKNKIKKYKIFKKDGLKIGVFGIGIKLDGLVPKSLYKETIYEDPIEKSRYYINILKNRLKCDMIICLSHLGYRYNSNKISDIKLAKETSNIDLIIGGHTHTFLKEPSTILNKEKKEVLINQVGYGGINIGKIDFYFRQNRRLSDVKSSSIFVKNSGINI